METVNNQSQLNLTTVKFIPVNNSINAAAFKELISKKITEYDVMYLRRNYVNRIEYRTSFVNGNTIISHSSLDIIKAVARELRDIMKLDFKLKLVSDL